jgi:hypothetical protein
MHQARLSPAHLVRLVLNAKDVAADQAGCCGRSALVAEVHVSNATMALRRPDRALAGVRRTRPAA